MTQEFVLWVIGIMSFGYILIFAICALIVRERFKSLEQSIHSLTSKVKSKDAAEYDSYQMVDNEEEENNTEQVVRNINEDNDEDSYEWQQDGF